MDEVVDGLIKRGYSAEGIHGDIPQAKRDQVIRRFKEQSLTLWWQQMWRPADLILAVYHMYTILIFHRIRKAMYTVLGVPAEWKEGRLSHLQHLREIDHLRIIENVTKKKMTKMPIPSMHDVLAGNQQAAINQLMETIESNDYKEYKRLAENLLENTDSVLFWRQL